MTVWCSFSECVISFLKIIRKNNKKNITLYLLCVGWPNDDYLSEYMIVNSMGFLHTHVVEVFNIKGNGETTFRVYKTWKIY